MCSLEDKEHQRQDRQSPQKQQTLASNATPTQRGSRSHPLRTQADNTWCAVHFQYRWRCLEDGLDCGGEKTRSGPSSGKSGVQSEPRVSNADTEKLDDEDLEDLELQRFQ